MYKITKIGAFVLGIIGAILWVLLVTVTDAEDINNAPMQWMFVLSYVLLVCAILLAILSGAKNIISSPQALKKTLIYTAVFLAVMLLPFLFVSGETTTEKWVSSGLISFYILAFVATVLLVVSGVKSALTK